MAAADDRGRLPSFREPPLEEVALAEMVSDRLPRHETHPGRPPMSEDFDPLPPPAPGFEVQFVTAAPPVRHWFLSQDHTRLLQVQEDLLAYNWRRAPQGATIGERYPRYTRLSADFREYYSHVQSVVGEASLAPNWCEVTYINHIEPEVGEARSPLSELFAGADATRPAGSFLPLPEDGQIALRYLIPGELEPRGRLNVMVSPAVRRDDMVPIWVMTLTARVRPTDVGDDGVFHALDTGHEWVVRAFSELTSNTMHERWGEERDDAAGS